MSQNGKGDDPRPFSVDQDTYTNNWERTFGKKLKNSTSQDNAYTNGFNDNADGTTTESRQTSIPHQ